MIKSKTVNNKKGFTIIEVLVAIALIGIVMTMALNLIIIPTNVHDEVIGEFDIQSKFRIASQTVNNVIRDASATFALHRINHNNLTPGWNYILPSFDISTTSSTSIIEYIWDDDTDTHIRRVIAEPLAGVTYNLVFTKLNPSYADRLIEFKIVANINGNTREVKSEVEALNSLQVVDRGNSTYPSNALAYRSDARPTQVSDVQAAVSMVLDTSGSMAWAMNGYKYPSSSDSRIAKLKVEALRLINSLSASSNIFISIVPFSSHANSAHPMLPARVNETANAVLVNKIENLYADGGTNTGDGLRRAFYILDDFNQTSTRTINNFMIVLVDGVTTFYSAYWARATYNYSQGYYDTTSASFFDGDNQISGAINYNTNYSNTTIGYYGGRGSALDTYGTNYVGLMGSKIKLYGTGSTADKKPIKVYVIGFSAVPADHGSLGDIALATSGSSTYYVAGDSAALEAIFGAIQKDISDSLWHIGGPN